MAGEQQRLRCLMVAPLLVQSAGDRAFTSASCCSARSCRLEDPRLYKINHVEIPPTPLMAVSSQGGGPARGKSGAGRGASRRS